MHTQRILASSLRGAFALLVLSAAPAAWSDTEHVLDHGSGQYGAVLLGKSDGEKVSGTKVEFSIGWLGNPGANQHGQPQIREFRIHNVKVTWVKSQGVGNEVMFEKEGPAGPGSYFHEGYAEATQGFRIASTHIPDGGKIQIKVEADFEVDELGIGWNPLPRYVHTFELLSYNKMHIVGTTLHPAGFDSALHDKFCQVVWDSAIGRMPTVSKLPDTLEECTSQSAAMMSSDIPKATSVIMMTHGGMDANDNYYFTDSLTVRPSAGTIATDRDEGILAFLRGVGFFCVEELIEAKGSIPVPGYAYALFYTCTSLPFDASFPQAPNGYGLLPSQQNRFYAGFDDNLRLIAVEKGTGKLVNAGEHLRLVIEELSRAESGPVEGPYATISSAVASANGRYQLKSFSGDLFLKIVGDPLCRPYQLYFTADEWLIVKGTARHARPWTRLPVEANP